MDELLLVGRVLLSLATVVGLVWYLARRLGAGRTVRDDREPDLRVVDRQGLTRGSGVAVVAVGGRRLLVGFGEQQVTMLTELAPVVERPVPMSTSDVLAPPRDDLPHGTPGRSPFGTRSKVPGLGSGPLAGSVLSPQTWRATLRALQDRTVRR